MNKPIKPKKIIEVRHTVSFDFNWVSKKVSLKVFQDWIKNTVPHNAIDVTLELKEDWNYDDCQTSLELAWIAKETDPRYTTNMKKYETKLRKWNKQCQK